MTHRHRCEVRHILKLGDKGKTSVDRFLALIKEKRGAEVANELRADAMQQWVKGNRGEQGDWRE